MPTLQDNPDRSPHSPMLTVTGVADMLACSPRSIYRLADAGRIPPPVRIGGLVRWPRAVLEKWIAEGCPVPVERVGLRDVFGQSGTAEELLVHYGLTAAHLVEAAERILARK